MADNTTNIGTEVLDLLRASPQENVSVNVLPTLEQPRPGLERYAREGVPLDTTTGAGFFTRAGLSFAQSPEARIDYISRAYGGSKVDVTDEGDLIVRNVQDQRTGKPVDLLVDERDFSTGRDLVADMTSPALRTVGELLFLKKIGLADASALKRVLLGSPVAAGFGEGVSATYQALLEQRQTFGEHLREFGINTAGGIALGGPFEAAIGIGNRVAGRGIAGELAAGDAERTGIRALNAVNATAGTDIRPSLGQMAASPDVLNLETFLKRLPFFGTALRRQDELRAEEVRKLQRGIFGGQPLQPLAEMGADLAEAAREVAARPLAAANTAEASLANRAATQLEQAISSIAPSARPFTDEGTAALTKLATRGQFTQFHSAADELFAAAGNPDISTEPLKPLLESIKASLPKRTVITESELVDAAGKPLATIEGKELVKELIPTELQRFIKGAESLDATMPLAELRRIRNTVDEAIREGRGLEGVSTYELKQLQHALTETINRGAAELGEQGSALLRANAFYRENIERFEVPFVARLLKDSPADAGYVGQFELVNAIRANPDRFRELEGFLKGSVTEGGKALNPTAEPIFNTVRRSLLEDILSRSRINPTTSASRINADAFISELKRYPEAVRSTLLGASEEVVDRNLKLLAQIKSGFKDVPADELHRFMRLPLADVHDLSRLATAKKALAETFENSVVKKLIKGDATEGTLEALNSEEALDWLLQSKRHSDVAEVMAYASGNPELVESIRRNTAARIFQDVAQSTKPSDAARMNDLTQLVDPVKLIDKFREPASRARLRLLLGDTTFNLMDNFATSQSVLGKLGQGSISTGATATSILTRTLKFFGNVPLAAKFTIYSAALTNPSLQKAVMEGSLTAGTDLPTWTAALVSSPPVLRALTEQFGQAGAALIARMFEEKPQGQAQSPIGPPAPASTNSSGQEVLKLLQQGR